MRGVAVVGTPLLSQNEAHQAQEHANQGSVLEHLEQENGNPLPSPEARAAFLSKGRTLERMVLPNLCINPPL